MARFRRQWGSVRSLASGRYQARYFDPDTRRMVPAPQTFATKGGADRWLAATRTELDAGTAVDDKAGNRPLREWWPGYWRSTQSRKAHTRRVRSTSWSSQVSTAAMWSRTSSVRLADAVAGDRALWRLTVARLPQAHGVQLRA